MGHIGKVCRNKGAGPKTQLRKGPPRRGTVHNIEDNDDLTDSSTPAHTYTHTSSQSTHNLYTINTIPSRVEPIQLTVGINNSEIEMELDTGASVSIIIEKTFNENFRGIVTLQPPTVSLTSYSGHELEIMRQADVEITYKSQVVIMPLVVVRGQGPSLFGRNWLQKIKLDWKNIKNISQNTALDSVLQKHSRLFREGLGKLEGMEATIVVPTDAQPRFFKPRPLPCIRTEGEGRTGARTSAEGRRHHTHTIFRQGSTYHSSNQS